MIYGPFSWDVIEPITYLTGVFYACVSMGFYLRYRNDFEWGSAYEIFKARKLKKFLVAADIERLEMLMKYKEELEEGLSHLQK